MTTITTAEGQIGVCATTTDRANYHLLTVDIDNKDWRRDPIYLGTTAGLFGGSTDNFYLLTPQSLYGYSAGGTGR